MMTVTASADDGGPPKEPTTIDLASSANRAVVLFATDEWFATAENLLNPAPPSFVPELFCEQGKVMDGWETRRRREVGHDWCVIKLGSGPEDKGGGANCAVEISHLELDTAYFTGNQAPRVSVEAMRVTRPMTKDGNGDDDEDYLYDWMPGAVARLARGGRGIRGTGQSPVALRRASEACRDVARRTRPYNAAGEWITILPVTPLRPGYEEGRRHAFEVSEEAKSQIEELGGVTHLRLNYYPDGGVARMRVRGRPYRGGAGGRSRENADAASSAEGKITAQNNLPTIHPHGSYEPPPSSRLHPHPELSSELLGGLGLACSNKHYGVPSNLLRPHPGKDMGDGWETARHPDRPAVVAKDPVTGLQDTHLKDWCVVKLGMGGAKYGEGVSRIIVDTRHFKGNFPESVTIDGCYADSKEVSDEAVCACAEGGEDDNDRLRHEQKGIEWFPLLKRTPMTAHAEHEFLREGGHVANDRKGVTHVRVSIAPDGGLSRVRIYGSPAAGNVVPRSHL